MFDEIDRKIIVTLQKDGRYSSAKMAKELGISVSAVSRRIKRLIQEDIITITAVPDPKKVGEEAYAIIGLSLDLSKIDDVYNKINEHPSVHFCGVSFGRFDVILIVYFSSVKTLIDYVKNELSQIDGVRNIEILYIVELLKRTYGQLRDDTT